MPHDRRRTDRRRSVSALLRDTAGNTLAIMAAAMIPVLAFAGSAIDTARMYVVKVRLQQACDAGALAGRKFMVSSGSNTLDATATARAKTFFTNNFRQGWMQTSAVTFTPTKTADQQVAGTATAKVPMTIMKFFAARDVTLTATCEARYDVADADIVLVLDTTGSMACAASETGGCSQGTYSYNRPANATTGYGGTGYAVSEKATSKIVALRTAVLNFYDTIQENADPTTHVRYGIVPYTSTVNAGFAVRSISANYLTDRWAYQSREIKEDRENGDPSDQSFADQTDAQCTARTGRTPGAFPAYTTTGTAQVMTRVSWTKNSSTSTKGTCVIRTQPMRPRWEYKAVDRDTSRFKMGDTVTDPSKITGATSRWQGCLEEVTTQSDTSFSQSSLPNDLRPDHVPTSGSSDAAIATQWRPMWPDVVYYRGDYVTRTSSGNGTTPYGDAAFDDADGATSDFSNLIADDNPSWDKNIRLGYVSCGKPVQRLTTMTRDDLNTYVSARDFVPQGGTYHDLGMIWGTRLLAPDGIFKADTAPWAGRNEPNRYIVFMTDGDMAPNASLYGMYGMERYDARITGTAANSTATDRHNARFLAECEAAKARNIRVFVVAFGQTLTTQLTTCASPGQAYYASDDDKLEEAFGKIAKQVAMLRVSK